MRWPDPIREESNLEVQDETISEYGSRSVESAGVGSAGILPSFDFWWVVQGGKAGVSSIAVAY